MPKLSKIILTTFILFNYSIAFADQNTIPNFTAKYSVSKSGISLGEMVSTFKTDQHNNYTYSSITEPKGIASWFSSDKVSEVSNGTYLDGKITSLQYSYSRSGGKKKQDTKINFDYQNNIAIDITNGETKKLTIGERTTDRQIAQILLMIDMFNNEDDLNYEVINKQELKPYNFNKSELEKIDTELGELNTIKVVRKRKGSSRETTLWLAEGLLYLPVRIKQTKDGSTKFEMDLIKLDGIKPAPLEVATPKTDVPKDSTENNTAPI